MKRVVITAIVVVSALLLTTAIFAGTKPAEKPAASSAQGKVINFVGVVVAVNTSSMTLVAKGKKAEVTFDVASAKFATGTKLEELKAGESVGVEYVEKDGKNVATLIGKVRPRPEKR
jgi:hypothetical protein